MTKQPLTKREKSVRLHNIATLAALLSFLAYFAAKDLPGSILADFSPLIVILLLVSIITLFKTRNADEYTAALWRAGTSIAFVITITFLLVVPFAEGFIDGFMGVFTDNDGKQDLPSQDYALTIALGSFFLANAWTRLRGTL